MLSLSQIVAKLNHPAANLENRGERAPRQTVDENDSEWIEYLEKVRSSPADQVMNFLLSEFQRKSKESGGNCVEYLRKLFVHTHRIANTSRGAKDGEKSAILIFRNLFGLAQAQWSLPNQIMDDMMACAINAIRDISSPILAKYLELHAMVEMKEAEQPSNLNSRWIEIFVRFIGVLCERGDIPYESDILKGKEFREHIIQDICRMDWTKPVLKSYLTILEEISGIATYEMDCILDKFGETLKTMKPSFLHSCIDQIVGIAGSICPSKVLRTFDTYFLNLQEKQQQKQDQQNEQVSRHQAKKGKKSPPTQEVSLGIVACNFVDASRNCDPLIREILKKVKASIFDSTLIMTPFMLAVVLALTNVDYLRTPIIEPLKTAILKNFHELNLCGVSLWYKETVGEVQDNITGCFKYVLKDGSKGMDYMCDGLKELGIGLLNSSNLQWKYPMTFKRCQELGAFLITTVVMTNKEQLGIVLKDLLKPDSVAHIDCLAACLNQCSRAVGNRDFHGRVSELLHHLPSMSVESASAIIKSLLPALQMAPVLLDDLMIVLRKTFWKSVDAGRICVEVICVILSNTHIVGNSQFVSDAPDDDLILSQLTQGNSRTNVDYTPLCREILNLGKRFFLLECKVREQLYLGLHRVARRNPMVNDVISGQLHAHIAQYWSDDNPDCRIEYKALFEFTPTGEKKIVLKDELGFLVQCMGFVYNKTNLATGDFLDGLSDTSFFSNCKEMLQKLITFAGSIETTQIEIATSAIIYDSGIQTDDVIRFVREILCIQTMQIMEALIEFLALCTDWAQAKQKISKIFRNYIEMSKFMKENATAKKGKGEKGKGKAKPKGKRKEKTTREDVTRSTQPDSDVASVASGSEAGSVATARAKPVRVDTLKPPPYVHIINLDSVCQMLRELYRPQDQAKHLRSLWGDDDFETMLLNTIKDKVARLKVKESIRERQRAPVDILNSLTCLIETMWNRLCLMETAWKRTDPDGPEILLSESSEVVEIRLEVIANILDLFYNEGQNTRIKYFNKYLSGSARDDEEFCTAMFVQWQNILEMVTSAYNGIRSTGNPFMFRILNSVCKVLDTVPLLQQILVWCWNYFKKDSNEVATTNLLEMSVLTFLTCNGKTSKCSSLDKHGALRLAKTIPIALGVIELDTPLRQDPGWFISPETAPTLLICISNFADKQLSMLNTVLGRLKAHRQYLGTDTSCEIRDKCFDLIHFIRRIISELVTSKFEAGPCVNHMLKLVTQFYNVLSCFAEHLIDVNKYVEDPVNIRGFKTIVTELGRDLKPLIESMIQHVEVVQRNKVEGLAAGAKKKEKVPALLKTQFSKDSKLIPNMVYHIERFEQFVIALSKKVKVDMLVGMKLSTARDFRIETKKIRNAFSTQSSTLLRPDTADTSSTRPGTSSSAAATGKSTSKLSRKRK